jgi:hypothetical protein
LSAVETSPSTEAIKRFEKSAKKYRPKDAKVSAYRHSGEPSGYPGKHGVVVAKDGEYVVQTGTIEHTETIPPRYDAAGKQTAPGESRKHHVPELTVMSAQEFEKQFEPA